MAQHYYPPWNQHFRPQKWMIGIRSFPIGFRPIFRGENVSFREGIYVSCEVLTAVYIFWTYPQSHLSTKTIRQSISSCWSLACEARPHATSPHEIPGLKGLWSPPLSLNRGRNKRALFFPGVPLARWWDFKHCLFSPRSLGRWSSLTSIFFNWVETTN